MIERRIIIGLITSTKYLKKRRPAWDSMLLESSTARLLANWVIEYFDKYQKAPGKDIETIFFKKLNEGLDKETAEEIEEDILPELSDEYENTEFDLEYLVAETLNHFKTQKLLQLSSQIEGTIEDGHGSMDDRIEELEQLIHDFKPINTKPDNSIDLSKKNSLKAVKRAFEEMAKPIIKFPKQLGQFWNSQFVRGGFISFLAPEKRGKTFWLLEIAMKATKQGRKVAFFQAGDMNEADQLKRIGVYLLKRSNLKKYCTEHYEPVRDCVLNQIDDCTKKEREGDSYLFEDIERNDIWKLKMPELIKTYEENPDHAPCYNCEDYCNLKLGAPWLRKIPEVEPVESNDVEKAFIRFFQKYKRRFKLSTHPNGTLSVKDIETILDTWQDEDGFVPDVIIIDYADLLVPGIKTEFRHQQNQIWKDLRRLSQTKRAGILPLVISPTQADGKSYKSYRLELDNYSEDKRKYGHVTAMYGLNQDPGGREKAIGLMRINEIIIREGDFSNSNEVTVLQNLRQGRPFKGSYF